MQRRKNRADATKKKIFEVTMDCLAEFGATGTTTDEIIKRAGISKGALYWHFKSKKELFMALFEHKLGDTFEEMDQVLSEITSPKQQLIKIIDHIEVVLGTEGSRTAKAYLEFFTMAAKEEDMAAKMYELFNDYVNFMATIIQMGVDAGELRPLPTEETAQLIGSMLDGLLLRSWVDKKFNYKQHMALFKKLLFTGIAKEQEEK